MSVVVAGGWGRKFEVSGILYFTFTRYPSGILYPHAPVGAATTNKISRRGPRGSRRANTRAKAASAKRGDPAAPAFHPAARAREQRQAGQRIQKSAPRLQSWGPTPGARARKRQARSRASGLNDVLFIVVVSQPVFD